MKKYALKIKLKHLACESRIIRQEELKARSAYRGMALDSNSRCRQEHKFWDLRTHRTQDVRRAARRTLLAYCYLRGRAYNEVEKPREENRLDRDDLTAISRMVRDYGSEGIECYRETIQSWIDGKLERFIPAAA